MRRDTVQDTTQHRPPFLDLVWREHPQLPRAVAALIYFSDCEEAVGTAISANQLEIAAGILADSQFARKDFQAEYGVDWNVAYRCFSEAMKFAGNNPRQVPGEQVEYAALRHLLYRFGYLDGIRGDTVPPTPPPGRPPESLQSEPPQNVDEEIYANGILLRINKVFNPAYMQGLRHGQAESILEERIPAIVERIDYESQKFSGVTEYGAADISRLRKQLRRILREEALSVPQDTVIEARIYARARFREIRRRLARQALYQILREDGGITPLSVGALARVLYRSLKAAKNKAERTMFKDQLAEAGLLLAATGFASHSFSVLTVESGAAGYKSVGDIVASGTRDYELARRTRQALRALALKPVAGRLLEEPIDNCHPFVEGSTYVFDASAARNWQAKDLLRLVDLLEKRVEPISEAERAWLNEVQDIQKAEELLKASAGDLEMLDPVPHLAGHLVAERALALIKLEGQRDTLSQLHAYAELEPASSLPRGAAYKHAALLSAATWAHLVLETEDPSGLRRTMGECEIVERGGGRDLEIAERWVSVYRHEAKFEGVTSESLPDLQARFQEEQVREGILLLARARLLERALDRRAQDEARQLIAMLAPDISIGIYEDNNAPRRLAELVVMSSRRLLREAEQLCHECPSFAQRLTAYVHLEMLDWLVREMQVAAEVETQIVKKDALCTRSSTAQIGPQHEEYVSVD